MVPTLSTSGGELLLTLIVSSKERSRPNLPVQAPTKYELIVNLKTAKALGLLLSSLLEAHTGRALVDYGRTMRSPFRANWSRRRVFDVQKKSNPRGDCVRMFWNSPSECVAIGHKTASPARECCTSWTSCSGPYSIRCANDNYWRTRHNKTGKITSQYTNKVSSRGQCKN